MYGWRSTRRRCRSGRDGESFTLEDTVLHGRREEGHLAHTSLFGITSHGFVFRGATEAHQRI